MELGMERECIKEAPTVEEAVDAALEELGVQQDAVQYEVLDEPGRKVFGLGGDKPARVRVWIRPEALARIEEARQGARDVREVEGEDANAEGVPVAAATGEPVAEVEYTDEELDQVADTAVETLKRILEGFGIDAEIEEYEGDEREIILDIMGSDVAVLIGRHGRSLEALQILVSAITNKRLGFRYPVIVDVEGYRHRRRQKLEEMAARTADRVARQATPVRLRPMNAYERRVIHVALRNDRRVSTSSEGEDPFRAVVVLPR
jgi:spoIIIJ-associated protein